MSALLRIAVVAAIVVLLGAVLLGDARGHAAMVAAAVLLVGLFAPEVLS